MWVTLKQLWLTFLGHGTVREPVGRCVPHPTLPGIDELVDLGHVAEAPLVVVGVLTAELPDPPLGARILVPGQRLQILNF